MKTSLYEMTAELIEKFGSETELCNLPESELNTGGLFTEFLRSVSGSDQSAYVNMRDNHAWEGTVADWIKNETQNAVITSILNTSEK